MNCNICKGPVKEIFKKKVLNKYLVTYYKCDYCDFIQTEDPYWLEEAYTDAISDLDIGLATRNISLAEITNSIIKIVFNKKGKFIDFAGGYGLFTRLMRDRGFDFYRQDKYCANIFAKSFDVDNVPVKSDFELLTAFEVFEHLENPPEEIENMLKFSDSVLFTTELYPNDFNKIEDWWYISSESGQHIAFYSKKSLAFLAQKYNRNFYSNSKNLHLFTNKNFLVNPIRYISLVHKTFDYIFSRNLQNRKSLLASDYRNLKYDIERKNQIV